MGKQLTICTLLVLAVVGGTAVYPLLGGVAAQPGPDRVSGGEDSVIQGVLTRVDTSQQKVWIKDNDGQEIEFKYDSKTEVEGSREGVQGLASETGTRVRVHFVEKSDAKLATKIEMVKS